MSKCKCFISCVVCFIWIWSFLPSPLDGRPESRSETEQQLTGWSCHKLSHLQHWTEMRGEAGAGGGRRCSRTSVFWQRLLENPINYHQTGAFLRPCNWLLMCILSSSKHRHNRVPSPAASDGSLVMVAAPSLQVTWTLVGLNLNINIL